MKRISIINSTTLISAALSAFISVKSFATPQLTSIDEAKANIISIVEENVERIDNFSEVREKLIPYIDYLSYYAPTAEESLIQKIGVWQQLWTDDADDLRANSTFVKADRRRTYQVIFEDGLFYNLTEVQTPVGRFAGFLRGEYKKNGDQLALEFTKIRLKRGTLGEETNLADLTMKFENGELKNTFKIPFTSDRYPDGPVGATGKIKTLFIDDDLRIDIGYNDADGVEDVFVLRRVTKL